MRLLLLVLLTASAAVAQPADPGRDANEARVLAALDEAVAAARAGDAAAAAPLFVCFTPPDRVFFPCDADAAPDRIADVMRQVTDAFGDDIPYVADTYHVEREGDQTFHLVQVKVRRQAPPDLAFLTFVNVDGRFLLAEVVSTQTTTQPADAEARIKAQMETLLQHASDLEVVAPLVGCYAREADGSYRVWACDPAVPADRDRAEDFARRLESLVQQAGPTGYGFVRYLTDTEREGTWHVLQIDYLQNGQPGGATDSLFASFMEIDGQFLLGDLNEH